MRKLPKKRASRLKHILPILGIRWLSVLYLSLYLPLLFTVYVPGWYHLNCHFHGRCECMPQAPAEQRIHELSSFLVHRGTLASPWTLKERLHLFQARSLLDRALCIAGGALLVFIASGSKILAWWPKFNILVILMLGAVLPAFRLFWAKIFHPLFFNNQMWLNTYMDVSYYIMPSDFFKHTLLVMLLAAIGLNSVLHCVLKRKATYGL